MLISMAIEGVTPLICRRFTDEAAMNATNGTRSSVVGSQRTPQDEAETGLYKANDGTPVIPAVNLMRCMIDAGKFFKNGKSKVTTQKESLIPACVSIHEILLPIIHEQAWKVDTRPIRIPATGGRVLRHRPMFDDWRLEFTVDLDTSVVSPQLFREIVDTAGKRVGLGDFRPGTKGPYGRFTVVKWECDKVTK